MDKLKELKIYDKDKYKVSFGEFVSQIPKDFDGYIVEKLYVDPVGRSGSSATWSNLYEVNDGNLEYKCNCIYKEIDYDFPTGAWAEKMYSIFGRKLFPDYRIPEIYVGIDDKYNEIACCSKNLIDNQKEDLCNMRKIMYYKIDRKDMKDIVKLDDILDCIKIQIGDEQEFHKVEEQLVNIILLDAILNNADRHLDNWGLIRNKTTNEYSLGIYDHSSSFINFISHNPGATTKNNYSTMFFITPTSGTNKCGCSGDKMIEYIKEKYPEITKRFFENFREKLPEIYKEVDEYKKFVNVENIKKAINGKLKLIEEREYEDEESR